MGKILLPENRSIEVIMNFKFRDNSLQGSLDLPGQSIKGLFIDSVGVKNDSVFTGHTSTMGSGTAFRGIFLPGDTIIAGNWLQGGGTFPLRLKPTTYVFTPVPEKSNLNPRFDGFEIVKLIDSTPVKDQQNTGTCWSFATTSFIETEAIRLGKKPVILSPMFFVLPTYIDKAERYIRMHGNQAFSEGDLTFSVLKAYRDFGAIPESVYPGKTDSTAPHDHSKMNRDLLDKVKYYVKSGRGTMNREGYRGAIADILYRTMGRIPQTFTYEGKEYTPKSFAAENVGINPNDYVEITSYSHHPFYSKFVLEIESNWNNNFYLNLPLNDFVKVIENALMNNYSVCWDGDILEGYGDGFCVLNDNKEITQEARQAAFDNYMTQDIHNMHIIGMAKNSDGKEFFIVKNSTTYKNCGGYLYMSKDYLLLKTISVMVNKRALPENIATKIN
jgi:bleomycin hydrolase